MSTLGLKLEDTFAGALTLTATERAYLYHVIAEHYLRGGWCPEGENKRDFASRVSAKLDTLKRDHMVTPDGSRLVSVGEHAALFERDTAPSTGVSDAAVPTCPFITGGDAHGVGAVVCGREATYECEHVTKGFCAGICSIHKSSCCTPKLEPLVMERLREMSRAARVAFFERIMAPYCRRCGNDGDEGPRCAPHQCAPQPSADAVCNGTYVDFQGADRTCLPGGEGCALAGCPAARAPSGGW